jgi:hypothetical protein
MISSPTSVWRRSAAGVLGIVSLSFLSYAAALSPSDSITVSLLAAAAISLQKTTGACATEDALLYCGASHRFSGHLDARVIIRASNALAVPSIEQGSIRWSTESFALSGGVLTERLGQSNLYKPHSLFNPFVENPLLWYSWGYGVRASCGNGRGSVFASATINEREAGAALLAGRLSAGPLDALALAGFQSYSVDNQDNGVFAGIEARAGGKFLQIHPVFRYVRYLGYDHAHNPSMVPGYQAEGFIEAKAALGKRLSIADLVYARVHRKEFDHQTLFYGVEAECMIVRWLRAGGGCEVGISDRIMTLAPEAFISCMPVLDAGDLRVGIRRTVTANSSPVYQITGTAWIAW